MNKKKTPQWNLAWLKTKSVKLIWKVLTSNGAKVYFVGGCVRDTVQGKQINDIDIATDALPSEVIRLANGAGLKILRMGISHGSVTLVNEKDCFEVTTFRSDVVANGRHSRVSFSLNILDDAKRRDFTMNAIYMTITGEIVDPLSGWADLANSRVRFIGKPEKRIHEDYLRILRYFRFLAIYQQHNISIDEKVVRACVEAIPGLKRLSNERVWGELQKILSAENPYFVLKVMQEYGILDEILPLARVEGLQRFLKVEDQLTIKFKEINRLAVLNVSRVKSWIEVFPLKKEQKKWLDELLVSLGDNSSLRVKGYKYQTNIVKTSFIISQLEKVVTISNNDLAEIEFGSLQEFPIQISDLLNFFSPSKDLGDEFKRLQNMWFSSNLELTRAELLAELKTNF